MDRESPDNSSIETKQMCYKMESDSVSSSVPDRRKTLKPMMEKKRRARINTSLDELKRFLLDVIKKEGLRHNKMEKADILELTVKHLRQLQQVKPTGLATNCDETYLQGFGECVTMVNSFLNSNSSLDPILQAKLLDHLSCCMAKRNNKQITANSLKDDTPLELQKNCIPTLETNNIIQQPKATINTCFEMKNNFPSASTCLPLGSKQSVASVSKPTVDVFSNVGVYQNLHEKQCVPTTPLYVTNNSQNNTKENTNIINQIVANGQLGNFAYVIPLPVISGAYIPNIVNVPKYVLTVPTSTKPESFEQDKRLLLSDINLSSSKSFNSKEMISSIVTSSNCMSSSMPQQCFAVSNSLASPETLPVTKSAAQSFGDAKTCSVGTRNSCHSNSNYVCTSSVTQTQSKYDLESSTCKSSLPSVELPNHSGNRFLERPDVNRGPTLQRPDVNIGPAWRPWS